MKVCTDSCLFGAWVAAQLKDEDKKGKLLDIGTGTGLLSLMIAQDSLYRIDAVEIDPPSAGEAQENIRNSPWHDRITVHQLCLQEFIPSDKYKVIISNPPFYEGDLQSPTAAANQARHDVSLTFPILLDSIASNLGEDGSAFLLIPFRRRAELIALAESKGLHSTKIVDVKSNANSAPFRSMFQLKKNKQEIKEQEIIIYDAGREYSSAFIALLQPYYQFL